MDLYGLLVLISESQKGLKMKFVNIFYTHFYLLINFDMNCCEDVDTKNMSQTEQL